MAIRGGSWGIGGFRLPEFGITEKIQSVLAPNKPVTSQGGSNLFGPSSAQSLPAVQGSQTYGPAYSGPQGGTSGGGGGSPQVPTQNFNSPPYESAPQQGGIDFSAIDQAIANLGQDETAAYSRQDADIAEAELGGKRRLGELQTSRASAESAGLRRKGEFGTQTENAVDESRRQFSEISQGLQARYGGTTGTGAFTEGLAGREALRNISQKRQALTDITRQIDDKLEEVNMMTDLQIRDSEERVGVEKKQAKAQLDNTLSSIRMAKGELMSRKVELAQSAMQFYQQQVAQVEARNTQFKQQLYVDQQAQNQKLAEYKARVGSEVEKFSLMNLGNTDTPNWNWVGAKSQTINPAQYGAGQALPGMIGGEEDEFEPGSTDWMNAQAQKPS